MEKWEEKGGQGQITEDFINQCNNLAFCCACRKRLPNSFYFLLAVKNLIYVLARSPYKDLMGRPWWAKMPSTIDHSSKMRTEN